MHIPHSRPHFGQAHLDAANQVITSGMLAQGEATHALEHLLGQHLAGQAVAAVDSGTSALMLAIRALTDGHPQPRVGIPTYACGSLLFAVQNAGGTPVLMDCNTSLALDAEQAINTAKSLDVLILVHPFGMIEPLVTEHFDCPVIEDIAQAAGAVWQGKPVGTFADVCIGSHYATKPWGGAYGGFISSQDTSLISNITKMTNPDDADLQQKYAGHHQLSNLHASMAQVRLDHADADIQDRQQWAKKYDAALQTTDVSPIIGIQGNYFRYIVRCKTSAENSIKALRNLGIMAMRPVQQPLHQSASSGFAQADLAWQHCVSLPLLPDMREKDWKQMQQGFESCFN